MRQLSLFIVIFLGYIPFVDADGNAVPERRKSQFQTDEGYAIFPYPYSLPGIGSGISVVGGATNVANSYVDTYGLLFAGDVKGAALGVADVHLISQHLILDVGASGIDKASIRSYSERGMHTDKNDYTNLEITDTQSIGGRLTSTVIDRRYEFYMARYVVESRLERIRDRDGTIIIEAENPPKETGAQNIFGTRIDLTDDYQDPRAGLRLDLSGWQTPKRSIASEYVVIDINTSLYLPVGKRSTWVFNYFQSDAHVNKKGESDRNVIEAEMGLDCATITDATQREYCDQLIDNVIAENRYGTASSLGGFSRLRAYPQSRYRGAHTRFFGTELRWNLTDEFTPFDWLIVKDIRTAIQVSFFFEAGTIADQSDQLGDEIRVTHGAGLRIVTASGVVFRGDIGMGSEGVQPNIFIGYPWEF